MEEELPKRNLKTAMKHGFMGKCPQCGTGHIFQGYLKVRSNCASCNEDFTPQRADDGPAWATMLITGHMIPPLIMLFYDRTDGALALWMLLIPLAFITLMTLVLLPRIKGVFISVQWANYMYDFDPRKKFIQKQDDFWENSEPIAN